MRYFWCELAIVSAFMITFAVEFNSLTIINIRTMVNYKDLGLVNTRDMFAKAIKGGYAIPAFNFNNMEQMQAIIKAAVETKSPVILQVSKGARQYANATLLRYMAQGAVEYAKELGCAKPEIVLHLDHGDTFETCKSCIDSGFSSVMIDGSHLPYEENVALTKKVVDYAHQFDVTVEGELGVLAGVEDEVSSDHHTYTDPEEVIDFATRTGCDSLAISIGTSHGAYKFTPEQCHIDPATGRMVPPPLAFEVLDAVMEKLPEHFEFCIDMLCGEERAQLWNSARNADMEYVPDLTYTVTLDGFIISDNIKCTAYENINTGYCYSDHDPVLLRFQLLD